MRHMSVDEILLLVDEATEPPMSKTDTIDFLERLNAGLDARIEGLKADIENETAHTTPSAGS